MGKLDGKTAIITGGASGIGEAAVRLFVEEGARVIIADILDDKGEKLSEQLGDNAEYVRTDVSIESDIQAVVNHSVNLFGRLDIMFNNAGIAGPYGSIEQMTMEDFDKVVAVNLRGVFVGMQQAFRVMKQQGAGNIINTASIAGHMVGAGPHPYSATKAAVIHLTRSVAIEFADIGLRANCICPGAIATPFFGKAVGLSPKEADKSVEIVKTSAADRHPMKRFALPEEIAKAALWLASDDSSFVNGHALVVDSGTSLGRTWPEIVEIIDGFKQLKTQM